MPKLSIVIPIYNVEQYLPTCLDSIVASIQGKEQCVEVILVNDGSTDSSGRLADTYADKYSWMKIIHQKNAGVAAARNAGLKMARGSWVHFMDSDDWIPVDGISIILKAIKKNETADILLFDGYKNEGSKESSWEHFEKEESFTKENREGKEKLVKIEEQILYPRKTPLAAPWDKVYRIEFLKKHKILFNSNLKVLDDMIFNMESFGAARHVAYQKEKIYHYRYVPNSITNSYRPNRVEEDCKVWKYIEQYLEKLNEDKEQYFPRRGRLEQSYYCRIIKSFSICCRLCFFHEKNRNSLKKKLNYVKQIMKKEPYKTAFAKVKIKKLEWRLVPVWLMVKCGSPGGIYLLHKMNQYLERRR